MAAVLTQGSTLECQHQGKITVTPSQNVLKVGEDKVLVADDFLTATIDCPQPIQTRCLKITAITDGISARLKAGGKFAVLDTAKGTTNAGTWKVNSAGQTKLEAT